MYALLVVAVLMALFVVPIVLPTAEMVVFVFLGPLVSSAKERARPQPVSSWARMAAATLDDGRLLIDAPRRAIRRVLAQSWAIRDRAGWAYECRVLLSEDTLSAWDGVRAIRLAMMAVTQGWVDEAFVWDLVRVIAPALAHYGGFSNLASDYIASHRGWCGGAGHSLVLAANRTRFENLDWHHVSFDLPPETPARFSDLSDARRALERLAS